MRTVIEGSIKAGESVSRTAERLLDAGKPSVELPQYVQDLKAAAKFPRGPGDPNLYEEALKRWERQIARLGQGAQKAAGDYTIRSATHQLVHDLRKAKPAQVDKVVDRWILERARYQARVVARHESVEAFRDVSIKEFQQQPWVVAVRWTTSSGHPKEDVCDVCAAQDLHGLGAGCYPASLIPSRHVSCICILSAVADEHYFQRETAKLRGTAEPPKPWLSGKTETGEQWLLKQSKATQIAVAGPTRAALLNKGRRIMNADQGGFRPVYQLLRKPKPEIQRGPRVDATALVAADRSKMARPFPALAKSKRTGS